VRVVPRGEGIEWDTEKSARPGVVGHNGFDRAPRCVLCAPATTSVFFLHRQDLKSRTKSRTFRGRKNTLPKGSCDLWSHLPPRCRAARNRAKRSSWTTCVSPPCVSTAGFRKRTGDFVSRAGPKIAGNTVPTVVVFLCGRSGSTQRTPDPFPATEPHHQDFYEHLFLSEKIVGGRVRLELVRRLGRPFPHSSIVFDPPRIADVEVVSPTRHSFVPRHRPSLPLPSTYSSQPVADSSDDEEEMWRKWEARNRPSRATRRSAFGGENVRAAAGTTDGFSDATRMKSDGAFANDASSRRHQRQFRDKAYATLLIRSRRNSERVAESARKSQSRSARGADSYCRSGGGYEKNRKGARPDLRSPSISKLSPTRSIHAESFTRGTTRSASRPRHVSISANEASDSESSSDVSSDASVQSSDYQTEVSRRGRSASKEKSYASHETRQSVSPTSPFETRSLALALLENDLVLASAGYGAATSSSRKEFTAKATTTFNPPRLFTSSRPDQRLRSRAATAKAWAQRELVEAVVMHTTHSGGVDGVRHWDCPTRAAAEQAAANASGAFLSTHGDPGAARAAARAAARIAAAKAARFVERVGEGDGGKSYLVESETSRKQPRGGSSAKTKKEYTNNTMRALRDSMLSDSESETSISDSESEPHGLMLVRESLASVYRPPLVSDGDDGDMTHKKANQTNYSHADDDTTKSAEADVDAFADFREELAGLALGEKKNRPTRHLKAVSEPTSPRGGRVPTPRNGRKSSSRPNSARHGLRLVRETPASELEWATGNFDSGTKSVTKSKPRPDSAMALPSSAKARPTSALTLARHQSPLQTGGARNFSEFLRSGQGGAGMARGRSVAALEERTDPAHAARLRRQLETTVGPAMAAARAERAKAAARVGWAKANDRARAVEGTAS
jgi:hypothetical protein